MQHNQKLLILGGSILSLTVLVLFLMVMVYRQQNSASVTDTTVMLPTQIPTPAPTVNPEKVTLSDYRLDTTVPVIPEHLNIYTFKTQFTETEIKNFGSKFGFNVIEKSKENGRYYVLSNLKDTDSRGYLVFDRDSGAFTVQSYGRLPLPTINPASYQQTAQLYVQQTLFHDTTILCNNSFERKDLSDFVYVVCHRNLQVQNEPLIVNFPGILNIPEDKSLASMSTGYVDPDAPIDPSIINVSNGQQGIVPPSDFNTVIVGIQKSTQRMHTVSSNIRWIERVEPVNRARLITPETAFSQLRAKQSELLLTVPAGKGNVDLNKVYAEGKRSARIARVTDYLLVYLEKPGNYAQSAMTPYYLARGTAELESGYTVRFAEVLPATDLLISQQFSTYGQPAVAGEQSEDTTKSAPDDYSLKQGSFNFTMHSTTNPPAPNTEPSECRIPNGAAEMHFDIPGIGPLVLANYGTPDYQRPHILFFKSANIPSSAKDQILTALFGPDGPVVQQYAINVARELQSNPQLLSANQAKTEDAMYTLFDSIDKAHPLSDGDSNYCNMNLSFAPPSPGCIQKLSRAPDNYYQQSYLAGISQAVARQTLTALTTNQVQAFANKPNLFPDDVVNNFFWIFINDEKTGGAGAMYKQNGFCYLSGVSPAIFVESLGQPLTIKPKFPVTYSYPSLNENGWQTEISSSPYLYYEYDPSGVSFSLPKNTGWVIQKGEISAWLKTFATTVGLTAAETKRLEQDISLALSNQSYNFVKIRLANEAELSQKLPLSTQPQADTIRRLHLLLNIQKNNETLVSPQVQQIKRSGLTVVEVGARLIQL